MASDSEPSADPAPFVGRERPSPHALSELLEQHQRWCASDGREGARAFAGPLNLRGVDLSGANLEGADCTDVDLRGAKLARARLADVRGLAAERLGGANLVDAELPPSLSGFESLQMVEELSKTARALLVTILLACTYCWLTIWTTMDGRLLANTVTSPLPIIQTNVPIATFYLMVPVALLAASFYLHLHLQKFWRGLASLPAVFPNAMRLDERVYPWLLSSIAKPRVGHAHDAASAFDWVEQTLAEIIAWWFVPLTIAAFWLRYLSRHDLAGSVLHVGVLTAAVTTSLLFRQAAGAALARRDEAAVRTGRTVIVGVATLVMAAGFSSLALGTRHFGAYGLTFFPDLRGAHLSGESLRGIDVSHALGSGAMLDGADLRGARLAGVPFERSNFRASKLEDAVLDGARLDHADLRDASLQGASLRGAVLNGARLNDKTDLHDAHLEGADLRQVDLTGVPFAGAHLDRTTRFDPQGLRGSNVSATVFHGMVFDRVDIRRADFTAAVLDGATFRDVRAGKQTKFTNALLRKATFECTPPKPAAELPADDAMAKRRFKKSTFDGARLQEAEFGPCLLSEVTFKAAYLQNVTFRGTSLIGADFSGALLSGARFIDGVDLSQVTFTDARLNGANLTGATNLDEARLAHACGDAATRLPESLRSVSLKPCPPR